MRNMRPPRSDPIKWENAVIQSCRARSFVFIGLALTAALSTVSAAAPEGQATHDLVLRNGTIYDGSGRTHYTR